MSILCEISSRELWLGFFEYKTARGHMTKTETHEMREWIDREGYRSVTDCILNKDYCFSPPVKKEVNKKGTGKKRVVYSYSYDESLVLKLIAHCLSRYDGFLSDGCCAFRRTTGAKQAIRRLCSTPRIDGMYSYKLDIKNYFNSIDVDKLLPVLSEVLSDDKELFGFFERLLTADCAVFDGEIITEKRGAMAGTPISPFFANIYLSELDKHFEALHIPYARYSDDIILLSDNVEALHGYVDYITGEFSRLGLSVNSEKVSQTAPGEGWEFLGIEYRLGKTGISAVTQQKLKAKLRRKARSIYRWKNRKGADDERAMRVYARSVNKMLFDNPRADELTWARWFFPIINDDGGLREIDEYIRQNMRFVATGNYSKSNYRITHEKLRELGLVSIVNEYYKYLKLKNE